MFDAAVIPPLFPFGIPSEPTEPIKRRHEQVSHPSVVLSVAVPVWAVGSFTVGCERNANNL